MKREAGFTFIELLITLSIVAILATLVIPSFAHTLNQNQLASEANRMLSALSLARSEAIKRGFRVTVCKSVDGRNCILSGAYDQGWLVFLDADDDLQVNSGDDIIRVYPNIGPNGMSFTGNRPVARYISYAATGMTRTKNGAFLAGTLTLCKAGQARAIKINRTGRARIISETC